MDIEEKCKIFNIDFTGYTDYYGDITERDIYGIGSSFTRSLLNSKIRQLEEMINPQEDTGLKFYKIFHTTDKFFPMEKDPVKLEEFKFFLEDINKFPLFPKTKRQQWLLYCLTSEKDLEPPNMYKELTDNIYLYDIVNLKKRWNFTYFYKNTETIYGHHHINYPNIKNMHTIQII